jgi:CheY-like chemotaxis protein
MIPHRKNILVVDHDCAASQMFVGLLKSQCGFFQVLCAGSLQTALHLVAASAADIVVTGINLAEIACLHLIERLSGSFPDRKIIHMTTPARQLVRAKMRQRPFLLHFDQTQNLNSLSRRICLEVGINYGGQLRGISLASFLQLIELDGQSCTLRVAGKSNVGYLAIIEGLLIDACEEDNDTGDPKDAALRILSWDDVTIEIDLNPPAANPAMEEPLTMILLESGRIRDEKRNRLIEQRKHQRYLAPVAIDYLVNGAAHQCFMRDISLGGSYIETEQKLAIGESIFLVTEQTPDKDDRLYQGLVVRADHKGVGIRLSPMNPGQQKSMMGFIAENMKTEEIVSNDSPPAALS